MYNRYFQSEEDPIASAPQMGGGTPQPEPAAEAFQNVEPEEQPQEKAKGLGALKNLFGGSVKLPDFDTDTILMLVLVYFLVAEEGNKDHISDTLLIIGMLLLLGF